MTLLPLGPGDGPGSARSVSADGTVAVGWVTDCSGIRHAALWIGGSASIRVEDLLAAAGVSTGGCLLTEAWGISDDGSTIVGDGCGAWAVTITGLPFFGACCRGTLCSATTGAGCADGIFLGVGNGCNPLGNNTAPCCRADYNHVGGLTVGDIFDFLNGWFAGDSGADFNGCGLTVQDIFDFLSAWFAGC